MSRFVRAHVFISGDVQGVGFRAFVYRHAKRLGLKGFVRNLPDYRVEAVFEGEEERVKDAIELCKKGPLTAWVQHAEVIWESCKNEFEDFEIRK